MAVAWSEVPELVLSLLDGISDTGLSQAWLLEDTAAKGCGLMCLDGHLLFQSILSMSTEKDCYGLED